MFIGEYRHNLDYKGRVAVPKKFRSDLAQGAILTKGLDGCLFLYPMSSWSKLTDRIQELSVTQADTRAFGRYLFGGASEVEFDQLGRIKIPEYLLEYAHIQKNAVLVGLLERIEIWSPRLWEKQVKKLETRGEEISEKLAKKGI